MKNTNKIMPSNIKGCELKTGQRIEDYVYELMHENGKVNEGAQLIYTDRKKGVEAQYNIRTDRFETALDAINGVTERKLEKRASYYETKKEESVNATSEENPQIKLE